MKKRIISIILLLAVISQGLAINKTIAEDEICNDSTTICGVKNSVYKTFDNTCQAKKEWYLKLNIGECSLNNNSLLKEKEIYECAVLTNKCNRFQMSFWEIVGETKRRWCSPQEWICLKKRKNPTFPNKKTFLKSESIKSCIKATDWCNVCDVKKSDIINCTRNLCHMTKWSCIQKEWNWVEEIYKDQKFVEISQKKKNQITDVLDKFVEKSTNYKASLERLRSKIIVYIITYESKLYSWRYRNSTEMEDIRKKLDIIEYLFKAIWDTIKET